jgi:hypothetical protein
MKSTSVSYRSQKTIPHSRMVKNSFHRRLIVIFWLTGIILGALHTWNSRHDMNADGVSYLDIADAYFRGDWETAINAYWSPLYSWILGLATFLLKPSPYYEFTVVHLVNFSIYILAMGSFHFLLKQLIFFLLLSNGEPPKNGWTGLPEWAWFALGYTLFIYTALNMITISSVTPDMCVAALVYLSSGILLMMRRGKTGYSTFALFGAVLGLGYLSKSVIFPLAFIFMATGFFTMNNPGKAFPRIITSLFVFLCIAGPFIAAISSAKGRVTFGDTGKYNYWLEVSNYNIDRHWTGTPQGSGIPKHPVRKIFDNPVIYEFGTPIGGTYPVWYDPSYWYDGIEIRFDLKKQFNAIMVSLKSYFHTLYPSQSSLILGGLILYLTGRRGRLIIKDITKQWNLLIPAITALALYSMVSTAPRYTGSFFTLLWLGFFSGIRLPRSEDMKRLLRSTIIVMAVIMLAITASHIPVPSKVFYNQGDSGQHVQWLVADTLNKMEVLPGDKVASIGTSHSHFWARLARVRIVAEIPHMHAGDFWKAESSVKSEVLGSFIRIGAKAVVTNIMPENYSYDGWQNIALTDYYVYLLNTQSK